MRLLRTLRSGLGEQILEGGPGLGDLLAAPDVRAALIAAMHAPDAGTREMAAVLLARSPEDDARQALAAALDDEAPAVRAAAAVRDPQRHATRPDRRPEPERAEACLGSLATRATSRRGWPASTRSGGSDGRSTTRQLGRCVADPSPEVRAAAMSALEDTRTAEGCRCAPGAGSATRRHASGSPPPRRSPSRTEVDPRVVDLLGTSDGLTTEAAAIAALAGRGEHVRDRILAVGRREVTHALELSGARAVLRAGGPPDDADVDFLCSILDHRCRHAESMALGAMTALGAPAAGGVIRRSLGSTDPDVRAQAIEALDFDRRPPARAAPSPGSIEDAPSAQLARCARRCSDGCAMMTTSGSGPWPAACNRAEMDVTETGHVTSDIATMLQLRRVPLFQRLSPEDLQRIASVATERWFEEGAALVREGEAGDELFVIVEGRVRVVHRADDGTERTLRTYGEGDHIGELAVLRERPRIATVVADGGGVRTLVIGGEGLTSHPARAPGRRDGDARDPCRADQRTDMTVRPDLGRSDLPTGTVTFLRTDVEGSMALARALGARWDEVNGDISS